MRRYTATWGLNLVPDPAEEVHESIYESAPTEIEGEDFAAAAAKVEQMAALDAQMTVPMDDKTGWTTWLPMGEEFPKERRSPHHRDDPANQAEPPLFAFLRINLIPDTDALKVAEFWESFDPFTVNGVAQTRDWADETVMLDYIYTDPTINTRPIDQNLVEEYAESMIRYAAESDNPGSLATPMARPSENRRLRIPVRRLPHGSGSQARLRQRHHDRRQGLPRQPTQRLPHGNRRKLRARQAPEPAKRCTTTSNAGCSTKKARPGRTVISPRCAKLRT